MDDELELVIVKDMMLTGFDAPPLHTLYLDRPLKGALLMQTLARVNRTFRGKEDGLLVAYAPLAENLAKALAEYTAVRPGEQAGGQEHRRGRRRCAADWWPDPARAARRLRLAGSADARAARRRSSTRRRARRTTCASPATPGNQPADGEETLAVAVPAGSSSQLARAWALCSGSETLAELRPEIQVYEEIRVWMAKFDAADRQATRRARAGGDPAAAGQSDRRPQRASGEVLDIYEAAGMPKPSLDDLTPEFIAKTQQARNPQLAIEALRKLIAEESAKTTRNNVIRQRAFSERITELMNKYTNQQLTSAEVIAELVELAKEVAAEGNRGAQFTPPLNSDELAFYDAVAPERVGGGGPGRGHAGRDCPANWWPSCAATCGPTGPSATTSGPSCAPRSSGCWSSNGYPPDKQPEAIKLVMEQMESMAPRFAEART